MTAIADALGHREFGVTGWSEGGPWALAAAAYIDPARLRHVSNIAGGCYGAFGDNWAADRLSKADALGGFLALHFEPGFRLMYAASASPPNIFAQPISRQLLKAVNDYDREILLRPGFESAFCDTSAECFAQGSEGLVRDSEFLYRAWAFDVTKIERRVHMWQGTGRYAGRAIHQPDHRRAHARCGLASGRGRRSFCSGRRRGRIFAIAAKELRA